MTRLIFDWANPRNLRSLAGFFFFAIAVHAVAFYFFQIIYPPSIAIAPPPARMSLLTPSTPEYASILRWIVSEDPAVALKPPEALPNGIFDVPYTPSFTETKTVPIEVAAARTEVTYPPAKDALSVIESVRRTGKKSVTEIPASATSVQFSQALSGRAISQLPTIPAKGTKVLEASSFLLGVSDTGETRYVFLQRSSGDKAIDANAEAALATAKFIPAAAELTWGVATFFWGNDAEVEKK